MWIPGKDDPLEGRYPICTECGQEITDGHWLELDHGATILCPSCIHLNTHTTEELLDELLEE